MSPRHISDTELALLQFHLRNAVWKTPAPANLTYNGKMAGEGHALMQALAELARRRGTFAKTFPIRSELARALILLSVGESKIVQNYSPGSRASAKRTAKNYLKNPLAIFNIYDIGNGQCLVSRAADGSPARRQLYSELSYKLSKMRVDTYLTIELNNKRFPYAAKFHARKLLALNSANWNAQRLGNGKWRVKRIS